MKKGFTIIEAILAMAITLMVIMVATTLIVDVNQYFASQSEVVDVRNDLSIIESRFEGIIRDVNGRITISGTNVGSDINGYDLVNYDACYFYNSATGTINEKNLSNPSSSNPVAGLPVDLSVNYEISSIRYERVVNVDNAIKFTFNIKGKDDTEEKMYQELVLSTLNPYVNIREATGADQGNTMICIKYSNQ